MAEITPPVPLTWEFLHEYARHPSLYGDMPRKKHDLDRHAQLVSFTTLEERTRYMMERLGFKRAEKAFTLMDNEYPYNLEEGIRHMVLFISPAHVKTYATPEVIEAIVKLNASNLGYKDYVYFEHPPHKRSLPSIKHYHVFYLKHDNSKL